MTKTTYRVLTILAIFTGVMLLLVQLMVETAVADQQSPAFTTSNIAAYRPTITPNTAMTATQTISSPVKIDAPSGGVTCPQIEEPEPFDCVTCTHKIYLPLVSRPSFTLQSGRIKLEQTEKVKGLTVFSREDSGEFRLTLDFAELKFSETPRCVVWYFGDQSGEFPFQTPTPVTITTTLTPGAHELELVFSLNENVKTEPQIFTFFYIPNGDFLKSNNPEDQWNLEADINGEQAQAAEPQINGKVLQLFVATASPADQYILSCNSAKVGFARASIDLELPSEGEFFLRVQGTVFTQDQNPSNSSTFDAFEVVIDGNVADRVSNMDQPIRCNPVINRQVAVDSRIPLSGYAGNTTISLENHRRFDNQYDTYTEIDMVWIDY